MQCQKKKILNKTLVHNILYRKLKIEKHKYHYKPGVDSGDSEECPSSNIHYVAVIDTNIIKNKYILQNVYIVCV